MKRQKKKVLMGITRDQAEEAFAAYNRNTAELEVLQGKLNNEITAVKEKYEGKISPLQEQKEANFDILQSFAEDNPAAFHDKKSLDFTHGTIGFRTGNPKLSLRRGYKWPAVLELVKEKMSSYIRVKEEIDKDSLLSDRKNLDLKSIGLEVTQDETFFVAPNLEEIASI